MASTSFILLNTACELSSREGLNSLIKYEHVLMGDLLNFCKGKIAIKNSLHYVHSTTFIIIKTSRSNSNLSRILNFLVNAFSDVHSN